MRILIWICIVSMATSCHKTDMTSEDSFIHVFNNSAKFAKQTFDDGIIAFTYAGPGAQAIVYRFNSEGAKIWNKDITNYYSSHVNLSITSLAPSSDGGCIVAGNFYVDTSTYYRSVLFLLKLDNNGQVLFERNIDTMLTAGSQRIEDIIQTSDGGWATITIKNTTSYLFRYDLSGNFIGSAQIQNAGYWKKLIQTTDNGFAALGYTPYLPVTGESCFFLCKMDLSGNQEWVKSIYPINLLDGTSLSERVTTIASDFIETPSSEFLVCGHSSFLNGSNLHDFDFFITKFSFSGDTLITKTFSNPYNDYSKKIILTQDNKIVISGSESTLPYENIYPEMFSSASENALYKINSSSRCFVIKLSPGLEQIWSQSYGNGYGSDGVITVERSDGSYLICGNQVSFGNKNALSLFTLQVLKNGNLP